MWTKIQEDIYKLRKEGIEPYCISLNPEGHKKALVAARLVSLNGGGLVTLFGLGVILNPYQCREIIVLTTPCNELLRSEALAKIRWSDELTKDDFVER